MYQTTEHLEQLTLPWLAPKDAARPGRCPSARPLIRELPTGDQPRARLLKHGAGVLSTPELLAVVLNAPDGLALAETLLAGFDGLSGLSRAATLELTALPGVGHTRAAQIKAALALGQRLVGEGGRDERAKVTSPGEAAVLLVNEMALLEQEHLRVLVLDTKNHVLASEDVYRGNVNSAIIRAAEVLRLAVKLNAPAIIVAHNHPSGDPTPSPEDVAVTRQIVEAGKLLDIDVLDHIVVGGGGKWVSLKQRALL
jgi:DNA repair protein RadC